MVEAAIVFPVVILVVMTVVYILISLYMDAAEAAGIHFALRYEAGIKTDTVIRPDAYRGIVPEDKFGRKAFYESIVIIETVNGINEMSYIRKIDLLKSIIEY